MAKLENLEQIIEAMLFTYGDSLSIEKIADVVKKPLQDVAEALENLKKSLAGRGINVINHRDRWQLVADKEAAGFIEKLVKSELRQELTPASLEVLAVVAYRNRASRAQIELIRGVNSIYAIRNLMLRGLIEKADSKETIKKTAEYQVSLAALRKLGLEKLEDLPGFREFQQELNKVETLLESSIKS